MRSSLRARVVGSLLMAIAMLVAGAGPAPASPELVASVGSTFGVTGDPGRGGAACALALMWPVEERFAFGAGLFADDLGTDVTDLFDPNVGAPLGRVASLHRWSFGGEWRAEARLHESRRVRLLWGAGFGYGRQEQDERGQVRGAVSGVVASTGATFLLKGTHGHAFGTTLALRREFVRRAADPGRSTSWATAAFEWRWKGTPND